ncbi:MAG: GGDEF domain-containing protein [Sulfurimonadaceae bacterium]
MSLKKFHLFFVLFSLTGLLFIYLYIAHLLENNIDAHVENSIHSTSVELNQQLRNDFSVLQQRFSNYEPLSLEKLEEVTEDLEMTIGKVDLVAISDVINKNVFDGHYEIYIINDDKVIEKSTSLADIGLDYSDYPYFANELDQLKSGGIEYKITAPMFDEQALDMSQYYVVRAADEQWVMIGFVLPFDEYVNHNVEKLQTVFPSLQSLDLFILTYDYIQHINTVKEQKDIGKLFKKNSQYTKMIMDDLKLVTTEEVSAVEAIAESFSQRNTVSLADESSDQTVVYSLTTSSSENDSDDFMLITKMSFDKNHYLTDYLELKNLMYLLITLVFVFMVAGFILIHTAIIQKISVIVDQMHRDDPIKLEGFLFSELRFFVERYNNFLLNWKEKVQTLNDITMQDELTKCANRRYFNQKMKAQIDLYERYGQEFSMIMFDIDNFKAVNDTYGHSQGDHVLSKMAHDVHGQLRVSDVLCRIGGEEFAIILPETNLESALFVAEKIRKRIENQVYIDNEKVTISLGAESYKSEFDFNSFYSTVDAFLYESKSSGKNCVHSSVAISS